MRCGKARRLISEDAEARLAPKLQASLARHLDTCAECCAFRDEIARTWSSLEAYPRIEPSPEFLPNLRQKIEASDQGPKEASLMWFPRLGWQWMAVALSTTLLISLLTLTPSPNTSLSTQAGFTKQDRWDDKFLQDLEQSMNHWESSYVPVYDYWPSSLLDPSFQEAPPSP